MFIRRGRNGVMVIDTDGLVIARFEHRRSRALDPQLHSHCLVLEQGPRRPRRVVAGAARPAPLRRTKTAGMSIRPDCGPSSPAGSGWPGSGDEHGQAELAGIPRDPAGTLQHPHAEVEAAAEAKITELEQALGRTSGSGRTGAGLSPRGARQPSAESTRGCRGRELVRAVGAEARDAGWEPARSLRLPLAAAASWCAAHITKHALVSSWTACVSSGRRSPAATSSKRSSAMLIPRSASGPLGARRVRGDDRRGACRPDGGEFASYPNAASCQRRWSVATVAASGTPPQPPLHDRGCSPSRAGSCTPRARSQPQASGSSRRSLDRASRPKPHPLGTDQHDALRPSRARDDASKS